MKEEKKNCKWCNILMVVWQLSFAGSAVGGAEYYLNKIEDALSRAEALRDSAVQTFENVDKSVNDKINKTEKLVTTTVADVKSVTASAQKTQEEAQKTLKDLKDLADKLNGMSEDIQKVCKVKKRF